MSSANLTDGQDCQHGGRQEANMICSAHEKSMWPAYEAGGSAYHRAGSIFMCFLNVLKPMALAARMSSTLHEHVDTACLLAMVTTSRLQKSAGSLTWLGLLELCTLRLASTPAWHGLHESSSALETCTAAKSMQVTETVSLSMINTSQRSAI